MQPLWNAAGLTHRRPLCETDFILNWPSNAAIDTGFTIASDWERPEFAYG